MCKTRPAGETAGHPKTASAQRQRKHEREVRENVSTSSSRLKLQPLTSATAQRDMYMKRRDAAVDSDGPL